MGGVCLFVACLLSPSSLLKNGNTTRTPETQQPLLARKFSSPNRLTGRPFLHQTNFFPIPPDHSAQESPSAFKTIKTCVQNADYRFQVFIWCFLCVLGMKICMVGLFVIFGQHLEVFSSWLMGAMFGHIQGGTAKNDLKLIFVMVLTPGTMNAVQFYISDSFLKAEAAVDSSGQEALVRERGGTEAPRSYGGKERGPYQGAGGEIEIGGAGGSLSRSSSRGAGSGTTREGRTGPTGAGNQFVKNVKHVRLEEDEEEEDLPPVVTVEHFVNGSPIGRSRTEGAASGG